MCHLHAMCHAQQFSRSEDIPAHCVSLVASGLGVCFIIAVSCYEIHISVMNATARLG